MSYYRKQLKRLARARKLLNKKRNTLREMWNEGITLVTFHTTTRTLALPFDHEAVATATSAYHEALSNQRKELREEARHVVQQQQGWQQVRETDKQFLTTAKLAQAHGRPPVSYPLAR